ncbi:2-oxo acid dehydrogenase subunit E2 [Streptomyces sp. NPDC002688]|uniref:2-oxo acid dehydrogenase subunit E2 n=1 Tax=Streptomyces sp. NPDC002688 TaxID=3154423 RepID=UPI00331CC504
MNGAPFPRARLHTLYFLGHVADFAPVFLDTDVDMTRVLSHRAAARADGETYSTLTYILHTAARVVAAHPDANAAVHRGLFGHRVRSFTGASAKITLDKRLGGRRVVLSAVLPRLDTASLADIQRQVARYRDGDPETMPEFAPVRSLQRLPEPVGRAVFRLSRRSLGRREAMMGGFAVTSLGHRAVQGFHSVGGTTLTFGLGQVEERPVVRAGEITTAPLLRLNLAFDHRVVDGAEAADVLHEVKESLESLTPYATGTRATHAAPATETAGHGATD